VHACYASSQSKPGRQPCSRSPSRYISRACGAAPVSSSCLEHTCFVAHRLRLDAWSPGRLSIIWPAQRKIASCTNLGAPSPSPPHSSCQPAAAAGVSASSNTGGGVRQGVFAVAGAPGAAPCAVGVSSALQACREQQLWALALPCMFRKGGACGDAACECSGHMLKAHGEATPCASANRAEAEQGNTAACGQSGRSCEALQGATQPAPALCVLGRT